MSKKQKNTSILGYFAKHIRKESTEIKKHEQKIDSSRPTCCTSASQSTKCDSAEERINLDRPNVVVPDSAFDIVCCLLGRVWNGPFVLVLFAQCRVQSSSVEARCSFC